jgi:hypothetical protein
MVIVRDLSDDTIRAIVASLIETDDLTTVCTDLGPEEPP